MVLEVVGDDSMLLVFCCDTAPADPLLEWLDWCEGKCIREVAVSLMVAFVAISAMSVESMSLVSDMPMPMPMAIKSPMPCTVVEEEVWPVPVSVVLKLGSGAVREEGVVWPVLLAKET
jgi:hypothetical protein